MTEYCWACSGRGIYISTSCYHLVSALPPFSLLADAMEWIVRHHGVQYIFHYVDDFILVGKPHSDACAHAITTTLDTFSSLGVPVEPNRCEGPSTSLPILGIEVDTAQMQLRLPEEKLANLNYLIKSIGGAARVAQSGSYSPS